MTEPKTPCLIPVRLTACVYDPNTVIRTQDVSKESGAIHSSPHKWAFHQPNYEKLDSSRADAFDRLWPRLFESTPPPAMGNHGSVCLAISPPPGFSNAMAYDNKSSLPRLPDRWLWVRIVRPMHDEAGNWLNSAPSVSAWIVDAGVETDNAHSAPILAPSNGGLAARRVGVKRSLREASASGTEEKRTSLHVQGTDASASITFAAFAPANMNNSSYVDTLDDVPLEDLRRSAISYLAIGWYRDPSDDPLAKMKADGRSDEEIASVLELSRAATSEEVQLGDRCIFHAMVTHIDYWNDRSYLGPAFGSPGAEPVHPCIGTFHNEPQKIGFGATSEKALSALLADISAEDGAERKISADFFRLLKSLLHDQLDSWDAVGSADLLRYAEQATTFYSVPGGSEWAIGPADEMDAPPIGPEATRRETPKITGEQRAILRALNELQSQADAAESELAANAETLYAAWWQSQRARGKRKVALETTIHRHRSIAEEARSTVDRLRIAVEMQRNALQSSIDAAFGPNVLGVNDFPAASYCLPKEPAVALRNVGPKIPPHPDQTMVRTLGDVATERKSGDYERLERAPIRAAMRPYVDAELDPAFDALAEEAGLIEEAIASLVRDGGRAPVFTKDSSLESWQNRIRRVRSQERDIEFHTANHGHIALSRLTAAWAEQPWVPLFLDWEVEWFPVGLDADGNSGTMLSGRTILASRPQNLISSRLERLQKNGAKASSAIASCRHLLEDVMQWDVLSQSLSGIHQQLLLRDDLLPRLLPADAPLRSFVESTSLAPPNLAANIEFDTVRRGSLHVRRLWVVDQFGQAFNLDPTIKTATKPLGSREAIPFAPRLLEPTRLAIDFDIPPDADTPVRGWVLPSLVDKALVVYDAKGAPLGMITRAARSSAEAGTRWRPVLANSPKTPADIADPELAKFVRQFVENPDAARHFDDTLKLIDDALARTTCAHSIADGSTASMLGRPLVLLRANVRLERRGGPTVDPGALVTQLEERSAAPMAVPIWIGSRHLPDDGVIGYRIGDQPGPLEPTAKLAFGPPEGPPSFTVEAPANTAPVALTLLLDPHGKVYLESEILPVTILRLSPEWFEDAGRALPAVIRMAPALITSHAQLRAISRASESQSDASASSVHVDLPLPVDEPQAILFTGDGLDVPVEPILQTGRIPDRQVAAIEGTLVI